MNTNTISLIHGGLSGFTLESAFTLINEHVVKNRDLLAPPAIESIGYIAGIIHLNDEVEVIVKFIDQLETYTQTRFESELSVLNDEDDSNDE